MTVTGTVAATAYTGDGSQLTGISAGVNTSQFNVNKLDVSGISTFKGNIDVNADLDVDGHTNLDNVSISGIVTVGTNLYTPYVYISGTQPGVAFNETDSENDFTLTLLSLIHI